MGIWEQLPSKHSTPAGFADQLSNAALEYYGMAADAFLARLVEDVRRDPEALKSFLESRMARFIRRIAANLWSGPLARIGKYFALVYATGSLASRYGVFPWERKDVLKATRKFYRRRILPAEIRDPHTPKRSIDAVRDYIRQNQKIFIDLRCHSGRMTRDELRRTAGVIYKGRNGAIEYLFAPDEFCNGVCGALPPQQVLADLTATSLVNRQQGGKSTVTRDFPKPLDRDRVISVKADILRKN